MRAKPAEGRTRRGPRVEPMEATGRSEAAGLSQQRVELMEATGRSEAMEQNERNHTEGVKQDTFRSHHQQLGLVQLAETLGEHAK